MSSKAGGAAPNAVEEDWCCTDWGFGGTCKRDEGEGGIHGGFKFIGARWLHFATFQHFD